MDRPTRQTNHLLTKMARKESLAKARNRKAGARLKQWRKWTEAFKARSTEQAAS
jgi:hypothetical protein